MLKITRTTAPGQQEDVVLRLEGQVIGRWVEELRRVCEHSRGALPLDRLVLDLAGVFFVDAAGAVLLRHLASSGGTLKNGSLFVSEQLKEVAHDVR